MNKYSNTGFSQFAFGVVSKSKRVGFRNIYISATREGFVRMNTIDQKLTHDLYTLAKPFTDVGLYDSTTTFFKGLIQDVIEHKISHYKHIAKKFERKYGMEFSDFSKKLEQGATIKEEDDWMEWGAAINMLGAWGETAETISHS